MAANKDNNTYSVVSYFSGCGGLDLGFRGGFRATPHKKVSVIQPDMI